jgi:hypothetical protein
MDMRFFGLRDRVRQHQFVVELIPGQYNIADFFTKALPKAKYDQFHHYIVVDAELSEGKQAKRMKTVTMEKKHCDERVCYNTYRIQPLT